MPIIDIATAKQHLRLQSDYPDPQVSPYLGAAELFASEFLNRKVFATQDEFDAALAAVPAALAAAGLVYEAALSAATVIEDSVTRCAAEAQARRVYRQAQTDAAETYRGMVTNKLINAAILLTLGHLFENRQENVAGVTVTELKLGAQRLLFPFRVGLGV